MKQLIFFLFLAASAHSFANAIMEYTVTGQVKSSKIAATKSVIKFTIQRPELTSYTGQTIVYAVDGGGNQTVKLTSATFSIPVKPGKHDIQMQLSGDYSELAIYQYTYKGGCRTDISLRFRSLPAIDDPFRQRPVAEKPVIYLYPETEQAVSVQIAPAGELQFTYPEYKTGWNVTANPDGTVSQNGKIYPYLFWEAELAAGQLSSDTKNGFVVESVQVVAFLEEKLSAIGLNATEQTDFITYWGPRLAANERTFVRFSWGQDANLFGTLVVSPQPEHVNRLYIVWSPLDVTSTLSPKPQELPVFDRSGFDVLEWGGSEIPLTLFTEIR